MDDVLVIGVSVNPSFEIINYLNNNKIMKKTLLITVIAIVSNSVIAQNLILNPGFEINSLATGCYTNEPASFVSSNLLNITAFYGGTTDGIDIGVSSPCYAGGANSGTTHIVMAGLSGPNMFESISFGLTTPIVAGQTYNLTFYAANSNPIAAESLSVGISSIANSFGSPAVIVPLGSTATYTLYSASFTASIGGNYLTIEPTTLGEFWFGLDDFSLELSPTTGTTEESFTNNITVYPNPTTESVYLSNNYNVILTDITGKIILEKQNTNSFDITNQPTGLYFLLLINNEEQVVHRTKIAKN